jgi:uncharacterized protein
MTQLQNITSKLLWKSIHGKLLSFGIIHLSVFGSYARWEAHNESDLDILIELSEHHSVTLGVLEEIEILLKQELSVTGVDFVTERSMNPRLRQFIEPDLIKIF